MCGDYCPVEVSMSCPKVRTCGNLPITRYPFIINGKQAIRESERAINRTTGEKKKIMVVTNLLVTKCKRYEMAKEGQNVKK